MDWSLVLAGAHHLAVFTLVAVFAAEFALLRPGLSGERLRQLARLDAGYGAVATVVILVGIARVMFGDMGWQYYVGNTAFWAKMAAFGVMGALTVPPTLAIRRWLKSGSDVPPPNEVSSARRYLHLQAAVLVLIPLFAAAMARGYGS